MTDYVRPAGEDATHAHYVWASGWLVSFNKHTREWSKQRIPHPSQIGAPAEPDRTSRARRHADDDGNTCYVVPVKFESPVGIREVALTVNELRKGRVVKSREDWLNRTANWRRT